MRTVGVSHASNASRAPLLHCSRAPGLHCFPLPRAGNNAASWMAHVCPGGQMAACLYRRPYIFRIVFVFWPTVDCTASYPACWMLPTPCASSSKERCALPAPQVAPRRARYPTSCDSKLWPSYISLGQPMVEHKGRLGLPDLYTLYHLSRPLLNCVPLRLPSQTTRCRTAMR